MVIVHLFDDDQMRMVIGMHMLILGYYKRTGAAKNVQSR